MELRHGFDSRGLLRVWVVIAALAGVTSSNAATTPVECVGPAPDLPPPSSLPLQEYETEHLYPWLFRRAYANSPGWMVDRQVRDTGPFVQGNYYGTHPAVRIHYSPQVVEWLAGDRQGPLPNGAMIIKEMFTPPAAIYSEIRESDYFKTHPGAYERLLTELLSGGWTVMIKDTCGESRDGWFWAGPGVEGTKGNVDDYSHVLTSGFGLGTCIRCHASAESENTFSDERNYIRGKAPLQFRVDNSWRTEKHLDGVITVIDGFPGLPPATRNALKQTLVLPGTQRPWMPADLPGFDAFAKAHMPDQDPPRGSTALSPRVNSVFVKAFAGLKAISATRSPGFPFPEWHADHVYPGPNPQEYITSSNCYGCHGGLGGVPSGVSQFIQTGPGYGDGYNVSPYGEWRWSPMGLAGRDPIFHAQIESEMIILLKEHRQLRDGKPASGEVLTTQQALVDTCLRCHGAMGLRQKGLDQEYSDYAPGDESKDSPVLRHDKRILNPDFDIDHFFIAAPLTRDGEMHPRYRPPANQVFPPHELDYTNWEYGDLAREGISCTICHNIAPPDKATASQWADTLRARPEFRGWLGQAKDSVWTDSFFYFMGMNNTGLFERAPNDELYGPFADITRKPMQHAIGITPVLAPPIDGDREPFTRDSAMCGTCHTINLPNIGQTEDENPILTTLEPNAHFSSIPHSIEQATYLEWLNSKFGLGKDNQKGKDFKSCQDCHMPNRFASLDNRAVTPVEPLAAKIATIQDSTYPQADNALPPKDLHVPIRTDYKRHELVGLNAFMVTMFEQFPEVLGADLSDYETGASNGAAFAIENMLLSIEEGRVADIAVTSTLLDGDKLIADVKVTNKTGHRLPSGVAFRRVWIELLVKDRQGKVLWGSGQTNAAGLIVDNHNVPLPTEFLTGRTIKVGGVEVDHQPNYQIITRDDQVQIYEELTKNASGQFTTSFVHRVHHVKDNRLMPEGWVPGAEFAGQTANAGIRNQGDLLREFMASTDPDGVDDDPDFAANPSLGEDNLRYEIALDDLSGTPASVQTTLYSQSFMPSWFYQRFSLANEAREAGYSTPATDRLYYIASRLNLADTPMKDWRLAVATAEGPL